MNPPLTYRRVIDAVREELDDSGIDAPVRTAEWMLMDLTGVSRAQLYAYADRTISSDDLPVLEEMVDRRLEREPLQYILGYTEFYGLRIDVSPAVLIPRPETEVAVDRLLEKLAPVDGPRVLDIGTGSGCIALAVAHDRPDADVVACDNSPEALDVARANARQLELIVDFRQADVTSSTFLSEETETFDAVVSNPPYVTPEEREALDPEVRDYEPAAALFTTDDPLYFYRIIARAAVRLLGPGGWLVFETHADYGRDVASLLTDRGYESVELHDDWAERPRVAVGRRPDAA